MKKLFILLMLCSIPALADCDITSSKSEDLDKLVISTDVPAWLKDGTIIIRKANGEESKVSTNLFKVVPRKQQFIVTKTKQTDTLHCGAEKSYANRFSALGGSGPKGNLTTTQVSPSQVRVETNSGFVGGLQYQRKLSNRFSVGAQVQTNESASMLLGIDF